MRRLFFALLGILGAAGPPLIACTERSVGVVERVDAGGDAASTSPPPDHTVVKEDASLDAGPVFDSEGWVRLDLDPYNDCGFYAAPSKEKLPAPVTWEACPPAVSSMGWNGKQIKITWPPTATGQALMPPTAGWVDATGKAWLIVSPLTGTSTYEFVTEADGPVHLAMKRRLGGECRFIERTLHERRAVFTAVQESKNTLYRIGAIGGDVDGTPAVLESWGDGLRRAYAAGPSSYFVLGDGNLRPWVPGGAPLAKVTNTDPGQIHAPRFVGDAMFFTVDTLAYSRIKVHTIDEGVRDFVSFGNDVSANAADFGTDGKDMVWTEAFGRASTSEPWSKIDIVTATFTADPAKIQKRRVRSEVAGVGAAPFTVGCGYAGHDVRTAGGGGTRLVRLSDGRSWRLIQASGIGLQGILAITCDEVFVRAAVTNTESQLYRIRLDSLGPGEAAD